MADQRAAAPRVSPVGAAWATRIAFLATGLLMSAWAPLIPLVKSRLALSDGHLGMLLLCPGIGLIAMMPAAIVLIGRFGARRALFAAGIVAAATLPALAAASSAWPLGLLLMLYGAAGGMMDVAMNVHAVLVERKTGRAMMSGFHGLWSVGCVVGAGSTTMMFAAGVPPIAATAAVGLTTILLLLTGQRMMLPGGGGTGVASFVMPQGIVIALGMCCLVLFLAEGSVQDWSGVLLSTVRGVDRSFSGIGYVAFATTMTICRLLGDPVVRLLGSARMVLLGTVCAAVGFLVAAFAPSAAIDVLGYAIVGVGAANVVPIMFSAAGRQTRMPANLAIPAITTIGYVGILSGPALVGVTAELLGLPLSLALIAALLVVTGLASTRMKL